jgi:hypothetical protein
MAKPGPRKREYSAGAFLNPYATPIASMPRTLSDEYSDMPPPEETDEVPEPEPPSRLRRTLDKLMRRHPGD